MQKAIETINTLDNFNNAIEKFCKPECDNDKEKEDESLRQLKIKRREELRKNSTQHYLTRSGFLRVRVLHDTKGWQHTRVTDYSEIAARPDFDYLKAIKHLEKTLGHKIYTAEEILTK